MGLKYILHSKYIIQLLLGSFNFSLWTNQNPEKASITHNCSHSYYSSSCCSCFHCFVSSCWCPCFPLPLAYQAKGLYSWDLYSKHPPHCLPVCSHRAGEIGARLVCRYWSSDYLLSMELSASPSQGSGWTPHSSSHLQSHNWSWVHTSWHLDTGWKVWWLLEWWGEKLTENNQN